jgi:3-deoxy-D-manno-octulosonic acid kinase
MRSPLPFEQWRKIGRSVRGFHEAGVFHADLNAHNILIDPVGEVFLIDFDKGALREASPQWKKTNLSRLHRSLLKLKRLNPDFKFEDSAFQSLEAAYRERVSTN